MPRRPRKQPRTFQSVNGTTKPKKQPGKSNGKMNKWVRREDIQGDDEDQFHEARDRILLEGEDAGGEDWSDGEEEVFGLGLDDDHSNDSREEQDEGEGHENAALGQDLAPQKRTKIKKAPQQPVSSSSDSGSDESESWGRSKSAYYASNEPLLAGKEGEEDEEEANEMEEREARRLQARMRDNTLDEDYGLDDPADIPASGAVLEDEEPATASIDPSVFPAPGAQLDKTAALRLLERTSPETLALAREWDDVAHDLVRVQERLDKLNSTAPDALALGLSHLHHQTLLTYVATLAFYLHLRAASPAASQSQSQAPVRLKPVLSRLLTLKQALSTMEELDFDASDTSDEEDQDVSDLDEEGLQELGRLMGRDKYVLEEDMDKVWGRGKKQLELGELEALLRDANAAEDGAQPKRKVKARTRSAATSPSEELDTELALNGLEARTSKSQAHKTKKSKAVAPKSIFDLVEPEFVPTTQVGTRIIDDGLEAYGEATTLSTADEADKKARKRTLRFHTSKIETSARRREQGREKMGGDDDIPYRERKKEMEARVRREVEKTRGEGGEDLDLAEDVVMDDSLTLGSGKRKRDEGKVASDEEGEDGYYELVKRAKKEKKEGQKRDYEQARMAETIDVADYDGTGGPRSLTRTILKNKGLTPRRAKSVRNPRVKKRERFEKAKKKVRSQKAVYKGGLAGRPYGGEESGITKVVKSVKL